MNKTFFKKCLLFSLSLLITIICGIIIFFFLEHLKDVSESIKKVTNIFKPITYGIIIAYVLRPICNFFEEKIIKLLNKTKIKKERIKNLSLIFAITISQILFISLIALIIKLVVPQLIESIPHLVKKMFEKANDLLDYISLHQNDKKFTIIYNTFEKMNISFDETKFMNQYINPHINTIISTLYSSALNIIIFLKNIIIGIVISFYLLFHKRRMRKQAHMILYGLFPGKVADNINEEIIVGDKIFNKFLVGKLIDSLIIWILAYIGMSILNLPYAPLNSVIIGITNIIPIFGPLIGAIPCVIFVCIESPIKALVCAIFILGLQQLDGNVIGPKILGSSTGISSFWILFSIIVFGGFWGITGMIIGIPCFAIIYDVSKKIIYKLLYKKNLNNLIEDYEKEYHNENKNSKNKDESS